MNEAGSFIQLTTRVIGWTVDVQLAIAETTDEAIAETKQKCIALARELKAELQPPALDWGDSF